MRSVTIVPALAVLAACSPDRPETRIRTAFAASVKAVEAGDAAAAVEILDEGFRGPEGMTKAEARVFLLGWFRRDQVGVTVVTQRIEVRETQAIQVVDLLLTGRAGGALLPQESSRRTLQLRWVQRGKAWRVRELGIAGA